MLSQVILGSRNRWVCWKKLQATTQRYTQRCSTGSSSLITHWLWLWLWLRPHISPFFFYPRFSSMSILISHSRLTQLVAPANGTRHVRSEPRVDTFRVEHVLAVHNHLHLLSLPQLLQTYRTVIHLLLLLDISAVRERRERPRGDGGVHTIAWRARWRWIVAG